MSQAEQARDLQLSEGEEQGNVTCDACALHASCADLVATNKAGDVQCDGGMMNEK